MKKKQAFLLVFLSLILLGCGTTKVTYELNKTKWDKFVIVEERINNADGILFITYDKDTKVEYFIVRAGYGLTITPIYNADGSVKVYGEEEEKTKCK